MSLRRVPADVLALWALLLLAAAIRLLTIDNQSIWTDEALTAYEVQLPLGAMIHTVTHVETTPPLYFLLAWAWAHVFGAGAVALRSISTIAGVATVALSYLATRELISRWAGVVAAALVAVNPFMIWFSQEARAYMLLTALCGASLLWFARALSEPTRRSMGWWAGWSALAVMTHFFAGFLVATEGAWLLWRWRRSSTLVAVGAVALVQLAMLPLAVTDTDHGPGWIGRTSPIHRVSRTVAEWGVSIVLRRVSILEGLLAGLLVAALAALLLGLGGDRRAQRGAAIAAALAAVVLVTPLVLRVIGQDYFLARNEIPAFLPCITVLAAACAAPRVRPVAVVLGVALLALFAWATVTVQTTPALERPDWRAVATALGPARTSRAILVAGGTTADPLKILLPGVKWVQPRRPDVRIDEVDVIAERKPAALLAGGGSDVVIHGRSRPRMAVHGARLLARARVRQWTVVRWVLARSVRVSLSQLDHHAGVYFVHVPRELLVFVQHPVR